MSEPKYQDRQGLKDIAAATGNRNYFELVAMPLDKRCYCRSTEPDGTRCVWFDWQENPEFVEVVW